MKLKKKVCIFVSVVAALSSAACSKEEKQDMPVDTSVTPQIPQINDDEEKDTETDRVLNTSEIENDKTNNEKADKEDIDVDLTKLSSTMVYAEVYNMMTEPEKYVGKMVKMNGIYATANDEATGKIYHACIISDATACCSQGIEFELTDDYKYPNDFPELGTDICVVGTFDTYNEGDYVYCTLKKAEMVS
ncbi:MAG: hypothetical protein K5927_00175 [Lachnospiraceae bacterium]|nr:hypothetical protein [Lachnospiraceae bacterium]